MKELFFAFPARLGIRVLMLCTSLLITTSLFGQSENHAYLEFTPVDTFICDAPALCFDLEIKTTPGDSFELFGVNFRLFLDSINLDYSSVTCTAEGFYVCSAPELTVAVDNVWGLGVPEYMTFNLIGAPVPGLNLVVRDTLQSLAQVCFDYMGDIYNAEVLCESLIWDKNQDGTEGFQGGSDGVIALEQGPVPNEQYSLTTLVTQHNWQYTGATTGVPSQNDCLDIICSEPCDLMVMNILELGDGSLNDMLDCAQHGDTILFDPSLAGDTISLEIDDILIDKSVVLYSTLSPRLSIMAQSTAAIDVPPPVSVEIYNIDLIGGVGNSPATLLNRGNLKLNDVDIYRHPDDVSIFPLVRNIGTLTWTGNVGVFN